MALAARSSDIHALSFAELGFEDNFRFTVLATLLKFQPKTNRQQAFYEDTFEFHRAFDEDRMLGSVGELKICRARTTCISTRKKNPQMRRLLVSFIKGFANDISKNTLEGWIRSMIIFAHEECPHHIIRLSAA